SKLLWNGLNSKKENAKIFFMAQSFMDQSIQKDSFDFEVANFCDHGVSDLEFFQKLAYSCKKEGRLIFREFLLEPLLQHSIFDLGVVEVDLDRASVSDEELNQLVLEAGFNTCDVSSTVTPLIFSDISAYLNWMKELLKILETTKLDIENLDWIKILMQSTQDDQDEFLADQVIVIREVFAIK
ncbi:hypothetical protein MJH12_00515, partial [bacterium]|nr:hypothetical protein [bacterium]